MKSFTCRCEQVAAILRKDFLSSLRRRASFAAMMMFALTVVAVYLDDDGRKKFFDAIDAAKSDKIILLATNDITEVELCDEVIHLPL